jgi:CheY-like chemotaxis protein
VLPFEIVRNETEADRVSGDKSKKEHLHILLVEDDPISQAAAKGLLELSGHKVVVAGDGKQAMHALEKETYDIILMDIQLPGPNGMEITRRIREGESGNSAARTPIIALTAFAENERLTDKDSGFNAVLSKPYSRQELLETINATLRAAAQNQPS